MVIRGQYAQALRLTMDLSQRSMCYIGLLVRDQAGTRATSHFRSYTSPSHNGTEQASELAARFPP